MKNKHYPYVPISCREYASQKGVEVVGKLKMHWEKYGIDRRQKVYVDEAGNKYYPGVDYSTIILVNGKVL